MVPTVASPPALPLTDHVTVVVAVFVTVAVKVCVPPDAGTLAVVGVTVTLIAGPWLMVTCADPERDGSSADVALTVTVAGVGTLSGAEYTPPAEMVPTVELPPATPLTSHVTPTFGVFVTVAVKVCVPMSVCRLTVAGATVTLTGGGGAIAAGHALLPAFAGAAELVVGVLIVTSAVSCLPTSSVTVSCKTVTEPEVGAASKLVAAVFVLVNEPVPLNFVHKYVVIVRLQAPALPAPDSATGWPPTTEAGRTTAAIGRSAAFNAPTVLAMPAPQVLVVQLHSAACTSCAFAGT